MTLLAEADEQADKGRNMLPLRQAEEQAIADRTVEDLSQTPYALSTYHPAARRHRQLRLPRHSRYTFRRRGRIYRHALSGSHGALRLNVKMA